MAEEGYSGLGLLNVRLENSKGPCVSPVLNYLRGEGIGPASRKSAEGVQNPMAALVGTGVGGGESQVMVAGPLERLQSKRDRTY